jgi:hypothetical protein
MRRLGRSVHGPRKRQVASELRRLKLMNCHIKDGARNCLPLTALRQYNVFFLGKISLWWLLLLLLDNATASRWTKPEYYGLSY